MARKLSSNLKSIDLAAYMDGEASAELAAAIDASPDDKAQIDEWQELETYLDEHLHLSSAPSSQEFGEYCLGLTSPERTKVIEQFLEDFPQYHYELNQLRAYLKATEPVLEQKPAPSPKSSLFDSFKTVMAQLISEPVPVRDEGFYDDELEPAIYEAGDIQIALDVEDDLDDPDTKTMVGLITGAEEDDFTAYLWKVEPPEEVASAEVDHGNFELAGIDPDNYRLIVKGSNIDIVIGTLEISDS